MPYQAVARNPVDPHRELGFTLPRTGKRQSQSILNIQETQADAMETREVSCRVCPCLLGPLLQRVLWPSLHLGPPAALPSVCKCLAQWLSDSTSERVSEAAPQPQPEWG